MKHPRMLAYFSFMLLLAVGSSCSKENGIDITGTINSHPLVGGTYLVQTVEVTDKWRLVSTNRIGTRYSGVRRGVSSDAANIALDLLDDDDDELKWTFKRQTANLPAGSPNARDLVSIHVAAQHRFYWATEEGGSVSGRREIRLFLQQYDGRFASIEAAGAVPDVRDDSKFFAIKVEQGGKTYYKFESLKYPGFFLVNKGHTNAGNGILIDDSRINTPALFEMKRLQ